MQEIESISCHDFVSQSTELLESTLDANRRAVLEGHQGTCPDCQLYLNQVETVVGWAHGLRDEGSLGLEREGELMAAVAETSGLEQTLRVGVRSSVAKCPVSLEAAGAYLEDQLPDEDQAWLLGHLMRGCAVCAQLCRSIAFPELAGVEPEFKKFPLPVLSVEQKARLRGLVRSAASPGECQEGQELGVIEEALVRWIVEKGRSLIGVNSEAAISLSELALMLSALHSADLRARVLIFSGLAVRRGLSDFARSDAYFDEALSLLAQEDGHPVLVAKAMELKAVNLYNQSRSEEALVWFARAGEHLVAAGETSRYGRLMIDASAAVGEVRGSHHALRERYRASSLVDFEGAPRYGLAIVHGCSLSYSETDQSSRGLLVLSRMGPLTNQLGGNASDLLRFRWVEARLLLSCERFDESVRLFEEVREGFVARGFGAESARVSLEASIAYLRLGDRERALRLVGYAVPIFESRQLGIEAIGGLVVLRQALSNGVIEAGRLLGAIRSLTLWAPPK